MSPGRIAALLLTAAALLSPSVGILLVSVAKQDDAMVGAGVVIGLIVFPFALLLLFFAFFPRLTISSAGIEVRGTVGFSTILVPWSDISRFLWVPGKEGIVVKSPLNSPAAKRLRNWAGITYKGVPFYDEEQRALLREARYVPVTPFAYWFCRGAATEQLRSFSKPLADDIQNQMPAYLVTRSSNRRAILWLFVAIAAVILPAIVIGAMGWKLPDEWQETAGYGMVVLSKIAGTAVVVGIVGYTWLSLRSAWRYLKDQKPGLALLWLAIAAVEALMAVAMFFAVIR